MLKNLVCRTLIFGAIVALVSGGYLLIENLSSVGAWFLSIPSMIEILFTALPVNAFTIIGGFIVWEGLAYIFPRDEKTKKTPKTQNTQK